MATASVQHTFAALTDIKSSEANKNFQDLVVFLNGQVVHTDASRPFTAIPSGPATDPSSANQFTRKAYVDQLGLVAQQKLTTTSITYTGDTLTDFALNNVSVIAGHTYAILWQAKISFASVDVDAHWFWELRLNGASFARLFELNPRVTGTSNWHAVGQVFWTPSVTQATDDLTIFADEFVDGANTSFPASATAPRWFTLIDLGV